MLRTGYQMVHSGVKVHYHGPIGRWIQWIHHLCDAVVDGQYPLPKMSCGDNPKIFNHLPPAWSDFSKLINACCGLGSISHGACAVRIQTMVATDVNPRMIELHAVHSSAQHVVGDIGDLSVFAGLWKNVTERLFWLLGFHANPSALSTRDFPNYSMVPVCCDLSDNEVHSSQPGATVPYASWGPVSALSVLRCHVLMTHTNSSLSGNSL